MTKIILIFLFSTSLLLGSNKELRLGFLSVENSEVIHNRLAPFAKYLENKTGRKVILETGHDYYDTIDKITKEVFDIAYLGPVPFIKAKEINPNLNIIASLQNNSKNSFKSVIIVKKDSNIKSLSDLKNKTFAFGSRDSTLSYYIPMYMLKKENIDKKLQRFDFLGRHDRVAQYVIMGKYDAGSVKNSIAEKYKNYIDIVESSDNYENFLFVASPSLDKKLFTLIEDALLELKDKSILRTFDSNCVGFSKKEDKDYNSLREIVKIIDSFER